MNNFQQRAITGLTFAFVMAASILLSPWSILAIFFLILTFGLLEFYKLIKSEDIQPQVIPALLLSQFLFLFFSFLLWNHITFKWMLCAIPLLTMIFIIELFRNKEKPFQNIAITILGMIYLTVPLLLIIYIAIGFVSPNQDSYHGEIIMGCILLIWASDTGAYMIGSKFGKHRLFERISPKKSWEGFLGGMITSILVAWLISNWIPDLSMQQWIIIAVIVVSTGTLGDLVESMLKRSLNVKDSGVIFPGHGGILDRFDGLLISIPFVFFYLVLLEKL